MTTAYAFDDKKDRPQSFDDLPESLTLKRTGESIVFDVYKEEIDSEGLYKIFEEVIVEGKTYPQESTDRQSFSSYFLSHNCFVFRSSLTNETIGGFYLKPNFPGRSSHIANCGLIVRMDYRSKGLGDLMMERVVQMGRRLGYESLYTNLVFVTNAASIKLCKRYGFVEVGRLPRAGNLKGLGYTDALQFYKDLRLNLNQV